MPQLAGFASRAVACELGSTIERVRWKFRHEEMALAGYRHRASVKELQKGRRLLAGKAAPTRGP
jgi:hypothetical protein